MTLRDPTPFRGTGYQPVISKHGLVARATTPRPRTVAWLVNGDEVYGVRSAVLTLSRALSGIGWRARIIAFDEGPFTAECRRLGLDVQCVGVGPAPGLFGGVAGKLAGLARLARFRRGAIQQCTALLADSPPDIVHFLWPQFAAIAGPVAKRLGCGCVWEMPNIVGRTKLGLNRRAYQWACRRYNILPLANSAYTAASLRDRGVEPRVFHLGADPRRFDPQTVTPIPRSELGIPSDVPLFGIFARIDPSKGQDRIIRALAALDSRPAPHLLLAGGGSPTELDRIRRIIAETNMSDRVHLAGPVAEIERYYGCIDVAINSRVDPEPFGLSVIEAMLMSKPVLAHNLGGPGETVLDNITGWHVPDPSIESFAAGLKRALDDRPRWQEMGHAGRDRAMECFTIERQVERYVRYVDAYLARPAASKRSLNVTQCYTM